MTESFFEQQHGYYIEDICVGMSALFAKTITEADVIMFSAISGDNNPLHLNEEFAYQTRFKTRIIQGMLTTSLWSTLVGTRLPGPGSAYVNQEMKFVKPVHIGDTINAKITVIDINLGKQLVFFDAECVVEHSIVACGQGIVWVPRRKI